MLVYFGIFYLLKFALRAKEGNILVIMSFARIECTGGGAFSTPGASFCNQDPGRPLASSLKYLTVILFLG